MIDRALLTAVLALAACTAEPAPEPGPPPGLEPVAHYDADRVLAVTIDLAPGDWDTLRTQRRSWVDVYASCLSAPFAHPFTTFPAAITIDGVAAAGTVRKRGFLGSLDDDKPSLKLALAGGDVLLANAKQDPSYLRTCLAYRVFAAAGVPAPRCNFARVAVNGADLGLYVHVEPVDAALVARHFADAGGNLYEATFSDFRDGWTATFDLEQGRDRSDLAPVVAALARPDDELAAALDAVVDLDALFRFWAAEVLVGHRDGYAGNANNYFAYHDPASDRFHLIPWGTDRTFPARADLFGTGVVSVHVGSLAPWRLAGTAAGRARYAAAMRALLADAWDEPALLAEIDRLHALLAPQAGPTFGGAVEEVRAFVGTRRAAITAELDTITAPPADLDAPPCLEPRGSLDGTLATTWGSAAADPFASGTGTLAATLDGAPLDLVAVGATAGWADAAHARARLVLAATARDGDTYALVLDLDPARLVAGAVLPIDWLAATGLVHHRDAETGAVTQLGLAASGTLRLDAIATTPGAPVRVTVDAPIVRPPF